jgi:carboxyl-terminal processing protease
MGKVDRILLVFTVYALATLGAVTWRDAALVQTVREVRRMIRRHYVRPVSERALSYAAARGMAESLDPNSTVLDASAFGFFRGDAEGEFVGLGILISVREGRLTVVTPLEGSPAHKAGICAGDVIVGIDGTALGRITSGEAVKRLRGKPGTAVTVSLERAGRAEPFDVRVVRERVVMESVKGHRRDPETDRWVYTIGEDDPVGYVRITDFKDNTLAGFDRVIGTLTADSLRGLVLDLRFNPGGSLECAVRVADRFLTKGVLVATQSREKGRHVYLASPQANVPAELPVVVLVNDLSASGAEIVAAALGENGRATLVGARTYGKGSVQKVMRLQVGGESGALKLTTAQYYTPSGRCIDGSASSGSGTERGGLEPAVTVALSPKERRELLEYRRHAEILAPAGGKAGTPLVDRQLARALAIVRSGKTKP